MPEPKAQLVDPQGPIDVPGINATGIITATGGFIGAVQGAATGFAATTYNISAGVVTSTGFVGDVTGTASSVTKGANLSVGVMTASSFAGDVFGNAAGLSTTTAGLKLGIVSATSFAGNFTGIGSGITGTPNIQAGIMTATSFAGNFTGLASGITGTPNLMVGILTGTSFSGDGSNLTGIAATNWITNNVTANSSSTAIDLALGNVVKFTQSASTTVSFANTGTSNIVTFIRTKDDTSTERTITWPSSVKWDGGAAPLLNTNAVDNDVQIFKLLTRDEGATWYGWNTVDKFGGYNIWMWGSNEVGEGFGLSLPSDRSSPTQISSEPIWNTLYAAGGSNAGAHHCAAAKTPGTLWMWGDNGDGELGQNTKNSPSNSGFSSPVQVPGTNWASVSIAARQTLATKTDTSLWTWGADRNGNPGQNNSTGIDYSSPIQIPGTWDTGYKSISQGYEATAAIKVNGQLWIWGKGGPGLLANNDKVTHSSPIQVPGGQWSQISLGSNSALGLKTTGTLWTWGSEAYGSLGQNNRVSYSSPMQIPGTDWAYCARGNYVAAAIRTDGTLWVWGDNRYGQVGNNAAHGAPTGYMGVPASSPVQVPGTTWDKIVPFSSSGTGVDSGWLATKTDGTLWGWGKNANGQLAFPGNSDTRSSPTQIPGTNWVSNSITTRSDGALAFRTQS